MMSTAGQGTMRLACPSQDITIVQVKANIGAEASKGDDDTVEALQFAHGSVAMRATIHAADRARLVSSGSADESLVDEGGTAVAAAVTVDAAGGLMGGAARFLVELRGYLERTGREDVEIIGSRRRVRPDWLLRRELSNPARSRRVALNNVGFFTPGGQRWTLLRNPLHFLTEGEQARLDPGSAGLRPAQSGGGAHGRPPF